MEKRQTLKSLWRELLNANEVDVTYAAFANWAKQIKVDVTFGVTEYAAARLRLYAANRKTSVGRTAFNGAQKVQVLKALGIMGEMIYGFEAIRLAEQFGACDRSTLYRRAEKMGVELRSREQYSRDLLKKLIIGAA